MRLELDTAKMIQLFNEGKTMKEMGEMLGCSPITANRRIRELGLKRKQMKGFKHGKLMSSEEMAKLYSEGYNCHKIGKLAGCAHTTVSRRLESIGIKVELTQFKPVGKLSPQEIHKLYTVDKLTLDEIAKINKSCAATVQRRLQEQGVKFENQLKWGRQAYIDNCIRLKVNPQLYLIRCFNDEESFLKVGVTKMV
jgi:transposase-like protein